MKCLVVILDCINERSHRNLCIEFLPDFSYEGLLGRFAFLNLSTREFPLPLEIAIASSCSKYLIFFPDYCCNDSNSFQGSLRLLS